MILDCLKKTVHNVFTIATNIKEGVLQKYGSSIVKEVLWNF